jgi:hypothetical protein
MAEFTPQYTKEVLINPDRQREIVAYMEALITSRNMQYAYQMVVDFNHELEHFKIDVSHPDVAKQYRVLLARLEWIALPLLPERAMLAMLETRLREALSIDGHDLWRTLETFLVNIDDIQERDVVKKRMRDALYRNVEVLTTSTVRVGEKESRGTVMNWLRFYNREVGTEKLDKVRQTNFFVQNAAVNRLSDEEKINLRMLVGVIERTKFSSAAPEGYELPVRIEGEDGEQLEMIHGQIIKRDPKLIERARALLARLGKVPEEVKQKQAPPEKEQPPKQVATPPKQLITKEEAVRFAEAKKRLLVHGDDLTQLLYEFAVAPQGREATGDMSVAALFLLAEANQFDAAMKSAKIRKAFQAYLQEKKDSSLLEGYRLTPTAPKYARIFLRWILEERANVPIADAARITVSLANTLRKQGNDKYMKIAYFDGSTGTFSWT